MTKYARTAVDILTVASLKDIRVYEISGRLRKLETPEDEPHEQEQQAVVQMSSDDTHLETRVRFEVITQQAQIIADLSAIYAFTEPLTCTPEALQEFAQRVGMMAVYPFLREHIFTTATRLGVAQPLLGILLADQVSMQPIPAHDQKQTHPDTAEDETLNLHQFVPGVGFTTRQER